MRVRAATSRSPGGMTLVEVLVAGSVFLGMLVFVSLTIISYLKVSHQLMPQQFSAQSLSNGLDTLSRELRSGVRLYAPDASALAGEPGVSPNAANPLVIARRGPSGLRVTGFYWQASSQSLEQLDFAAAVYDPKNLPKTHHKIADAMGFWMQLQGGPSGLQCRLRLEGPAGQPPWQTALAWTAELGR